LAYEKLKSTCAKQASRRAIGDRNRLLCETSGSAREYARVESTTRAKWCYYSVCNSVGQGIATALSRLSRRAAISIDDVRVSRPTPPKCLPATATDATPAASTGDGGNAAWRVTQVNKDKLLPPVRLGMEIDAADLILPIAGSWHAAAGSSRSAFGSGAMALPVQALKSGITPGISEEDVLCTDKRDPSLMACTFQSWKWTGRRAY